MKCVSKLHQQATDGHIWSFCFPLVIVLSNLSFSIFLKTYGFFDSVMFTSQIFGSFSDTLYYLLESYYDLSYLSSSVSSSFLCIVEYDVS